MDDQIPSWNGRCERRWEEKSSFSSFRAPHKPLSENSVANSAVEMQAVEIDDIGVTVHTTPQPCLQCHDSIYFFLSLDALLTFAVPLNFFDRFFLCFPVASLC